MTDLDRLITNARDATVDRDRADAYVRELGRWAVPEPARPRWAPWLAAGFAAAAAAAIVLVVMRTRDVSSPSTPIRIGDRVAIVADPGTDYRVVRASADETTIAIERGQVTARLWPGARSHRLSLEGGGVTATAHGTVYSLEVRDGRAVVHVDQGIVDVRDGSDKHEVPAGASWPSSRNGGASTATTVLLALSTAPPGAEAPPGSDAPIVDARATADASDAPSTTGVNPPHPVTPEIAAQPSVKERWRRARVLRGQGELEKAVAECLAIADAHDPTWSPIALVEAIRIYLGPLSNPALALATADRMISDWPGDALAAEARDLRCRALRELGRGGECAGSATP